MTTVTFAIEDDLASALTAQATGKGITLQDMMRKLAEREAASIQDAMVQEDLVERMRNLRAQSKPDPDGMTVRDYVVHGRR